MDKAQEKRAHVVKERKKKTKKQTANDNLQSGSND